MDPTHRHLLRRMSWFRPGSVFMGRELRMPSIPSVELMDLIGLRVLEEDPGLSPAEEMAQVQAYAWIHSEPVAMVSASLWSGAWREVLETGTMSEPEMMAAVTEWRCYREPIRQLIEANDFTVMKKPRPASSTGGKSSAPSPPSTLIHCTTAGHRMARVMGHLGISDPLAVWDLPWWEAMQIYHADRRHEDLWTVPKAEEREAEDFDDFTLAGIDTPPGV